ncbi:MAG: hypothetical protein ABI999_13495 [Acidobacteriota bacterium]
MRFLVDLDLLDPLVPSDQLPKIFAGSAVAQALYATLDECMYFFRQRQGNDLS